MNSNLFFTKEDYDALCKRISEIAQKVKEHTVSVGQVVDSSGDAWHDNQLYYEQRMSESWSNNLRNLLDIKGRAIIIETPLLQDGKVRFGTVVKILNLESGEIFSYRVSSYMVAESANQKEVGRISYASPLGRLLIGAIIGEIREGVVGSNKKGSKYSK